MDLTLSIVLDANRVALLFTSWSWRSKIKHQLIIDLQVWNPNCVFHVESTSNLLEHLSDSSRYQTSILIVLHTAAHCESFSCTCLTIYKDCAIETVNYWLDNVSCTRIEHILLSRVMKELIKFEAPRLLLVINMTSMLILRNVNIHMLYIIV